MPVQLSPASSSGLVTSAYVQDALAAGGWTLTTAQATVLPQVIAAAGRLIRRHCNRYFNRLTYDGLYTIDQPGSSLLLRQFPVNAITRLGTNPTAVLTVSNGDTATNQRATVQLATSGVADYPDQPQPVTGLVLTRWASGSAIAVSVPLGANATIQALASAVNGLGAGWTAQVLTGYGLWPSADLRGCQGASPALGASAAELQIHVDDLPFALVQSTGQITITDSSVDPFSSIRFGPYLSTSVDDLGVYGGVNGIRCVYDAGWDTVPEDVQQAAVELVADLLRLLASNSRLGSETIGGYGYVLNTAFADYALPKPVRGKLSYYINHRA